MNKKKTVNQNFYSSNYSNESWRSLLQNEALLLLERIKNLHLFKKGSSVLDVGCGSGDLGGMIKQKFNASVHGTEINDVAIEKAAKQGILVKHADIEEGWPYKDKQFNVVTATEIIEHVVDPDHVLVEAKRVLKKNGYLVITTPNLSAWFNRIIFLFGYHPFFMEASTVDKTVGLKFTRRLTSNREPVGHIRCFTLRALRDILELHGYKIVLIKGNRGYYFPQPMKTVDVLMSYVPSLSANLTVVAKKIKD